MSVCPTCSHTELSGSLFCSECGTQLVYSKEDEAPSTVVYPKDRKKKPGVPVEPPAPPFPAGITDASITLQVADSGQLIPLQGWGEITLGRITGNQPVVPDIDLGPYQAFQAGVSRLHASIRIGSDGVKISDLGSSNGTRVNGKKLAAHTPQTLKHGDLLTLGMLRLQVLIRS
jgi:hypothetical protein